MPRFVYHAMLINFNTSVSICVDDDDVVDIGVNVSVYFYCNAICNVNSVLLLLRLSSAVRLATATDKLFRHSVPPLTFYALRYLSTVPNFCYILLLFSILLPLF